MLELLFLLHLLLNSLRITAPSSTYLMSRLLILLWIKITLIIVFRVCANVWLTAYWTNAEVIDYITLAFTAFSRIRHNHLMQNSFVHISVNHKLNSWNILLLLLMLLMLLLASMWVWTIAWILVLRLWLRIEAELLIVKDLGMLRLLLGVVSLIEDILEVTHVILSLDIWRGWSSSLAWSASWLGKFSQI